jgi:glucose-6-phosphate isomerase
LLLSALTPENLGALVALYEHKTFVQGVLWGINPFDQWGVELGKSLASRILPAVREKDRASGFDASTQELLAFCRDYLL